MATSAAVTPTWRARFSLFFSTRRGRQAVWLLVALGVALRVVVWGQARSVYLDEVGLLRNLLERDYAGLFRPLGYYQYAPPLLAMLLKASVQLLGNGEQTIRLVPMLASCAMLALFGWLALRWLAPWWAVLAVATVAFSSIYLEFATACKQYSTDALVDVGLLVLAERQLRRPVLSGRAALGWAAGGAVAVWCSMPAIFVLAGVGAALAWAYARPRPTGATLARLALVAGAWALSFGVYFKLLLQADAQSSYLQTYQHDAFLPVPRSGADWQLAGSLLMGLADKGFGKTTLAIALAGVGVLAGAGQLLRRPTARTWLLLVPLLAVLAASLLHYYSLRPRLMLWALPLALLLALLGLSNLGGRWRWLGGLLLALAVAVVGNQQRLRFFWQPLTTDYADVRGALAYVAARQLPTDTVYVYHNEAQVGYYYLRLHPRPLPLRHVLLETYRYLPGDDITQHNLLALVGARRARIWLSYDRPDPWLREWAAQHGTVSQLATFHEGYAFLWEANAKW